MFYSRLPGAFAQVLIRKGSGRDQILRLGSTLLNHQIRTAPTTTTNKIVSFIVLPLSQLFSVGAQHD